MISRQKPIARASAKRLKKAGGKLYSTISTPRKAIKKKARSKSERERIYGPKGYVEWIHGEPCYACGISRYSQCAHIGTGGMGRKDDWVRTIPLCGPRTIFVRNAMTLYAGCHWILDNKGIDALGELFGPFNLARAAEQTHHRWIEYQRTSK